MNKQILEDFDYFSVEDTRNFQENNLNIDLWIEVSDKKVLSVQKNTHKIILRPFSEI